MTIHFQSMLQNSVCNLNGILLDKMIQGSTVQFLYHFSIGIEDSDPPEIKAEPLKETNILNVMMHC